MRRTELSEFLRAHARTQLSPSAEDRRVVDLVFAAIRRALGNTCYLVGSFARLTATRPLHDVDVLFVAGQFDPNAINPKAILQELQTSIQQKFLNPTLFQTNIAVQSHSVTIQFLDRGKEKFAVDVVPAFSSAAKNDAGDDIFWVPEILNVSKPNREERYAQLAKSNRRELDWWIKSDPLGYIRESAHLDQLNPDFRKAAKIVKSWKNNCRSKDKSFPLKSFHLEQAMFEVFRRNPRCDIGAAVFTFFCGVPSLIERPQIKDRADRSRFIDQYIAELPLAQRQRIIEARDFLMIKLEQVSGGASVADVLEGGYHQRACKAEEYLFDSRIPVLTQEDARVQVNGTVLWKEGFRSGPLDRIGRVQPGRQIRFDAKFQGPYEVDLFKWKVKNDNRCEQPRGEITDHRTRCNPESTKYRGSHFVECYAIKDNVCIARSRQNVEITF